MLWQLRGLGVISGIVIYLSREHGDVTDALTALRQQPGLELGDGTDPWCVPAVLESPSGNQGRETVRSLEDLPGVERVEVAFVSFDDAPSNRREPECNSTVVTS